MGVPRHSAQSRGCKIETLESRVLLAAAPLRIDAGGPAYTDTNGQKWLADTYFTGGTAANYSYPVANTINDPIYYSRRFGDFSYNIPLANGSYTLNLLFSESVMGQPTQREFNVIAQGTQMLTKFDLVATAGPKTALHETFPVSVTNGNLSIKFVSVANFAIVSGIEILAAPVVSVPTPGFTPLFNGTNLNGFYTYLPSKGVNNDPQHVFKVENNAVHVLDLPATTGTQEFGYFGTTASYSNYRLRFEYQWGTKQFAPKLNLPRDAGLVFDVVGSDQLWPTSVEEQVQEGDTGDVWLLNGSSATSTVASPTANPPSYSYTGTATTFTSNSKTYTRIKKNQTEDTLTGWNTVELDVTGDSAAYVVNGVVVNRLTHIRQPDPANPGKYIPLTSGRILFQAEGSEVYYRNIEIQQLVFTKAPTGATTLFNGSSTAAWEPENSTGKIAWPVNSDGDLVVKPGAGDIRTLNTYTDFTLHVEFNNNVVSQGAIEQNRGNSGIYLQGRYEIQVLDSFDHPIADKNDVGAIYGIADPTTNAALPSGTWESYDIKFHAARWNGTTKISNASVTAILNGTMVQNNVQIPTNTLLGNAESPTAGPIVLQDHNNTVQYRNIWILPG